MPAEWARHERTLMAWPTRFELWGDQLQAARDDYAATANAIAAFEPLTMVCASAGEAAQARAALTAAAEVVELPIDDSWLRDCGPIFVVDRDGRRAGVPCGFNSWGRKFEPWDRDAAVGSLLVEHIDDRCYRAPFVLEGGAVAVDGEGTLLTTEQCLLNPNRNPGMSREEIEAGLRDHLGVETIVWLGEGLVTDGHVDMLAAFTRPGEVLLQSLEPGAPSAERMAENRARLLAAGLDVVDFPILASVEVAGEPVAVCQLNFYLCNGAAIVPLAGAYGGGGPHCITQQVPAAG